MRHTKRKYTWLIERQEEAVCKRRRRRRIRGRVRGKWRLLGILQHWQRYWAGGAGARLYDAGSMLQRLPLVQADILNDYFRRT